VKGYISGLNDLRYGHIQGNGFSGTRTGGITTLTWRSNGELYDGYVLLRDGEIAGYLCSSIGGEECDLEAILENLTTAIVELYEGNPDVNWRTSGHTVLRRLMPLIDRFSGVVVHNGLEIEVSRGIVKSRKIFELLDDRVLIFIKPGKKIDGLRIKEVVELIEEKKDWDVRAPVSRESVWRT